MFLKLNSSMDMVWKTTFYLLIWIFLIEGIIYFRISTKKLSNNIRIVCRFLLGNWNACAALGSNQFGKFRLGFMTINCQPTHQPPHTPTPTPRVPPALLDTYYHNWKMMRNFASRSIKKGGKRICHAVANVPAIIENHHTSHSIYIRIVNS